MSSNGLITFLAWSFQTGRPSASASWNLLSTTLWTPAPCEVTTTLRFVLSSPNVKVRRGMAAAAGSSFAGSRFGSVLRATTGSFRSLAAFSAVAISAARIEALPIPGTPGVAASAARAESSPHRYGLSGSFAAGGSGFGRSTGGQILCWIQNQATKMSSDRAKKSRVFLVFCMINQERKTKDEAQRDE